MKIEEDIKLDFCDVLLKPKRSTLESRSDIDLQRTFKFLYSSNILSCIPIIPSNMDTIGTLKMANAFQLSNMIGMLHKFYTVDKNIQAAKNFNSLFHSIGINNLSTEIDKLKTIENATKHNLYICIDAANGYTDSFVRAVRYVRDCFPTSCIMAGNICTGEMAQELIINGKADIIKAGIGPGRTCQTRKVTGVGYPQLSTIIELADVCHGLGAHICADGGIRESGDVVKAFGAGADFVMLGSYLAGHDECGGEWYHKYGCKNIEDDSPIPAEELEEAKPNIVHKIYGMSSTDAHKKYYSGSDYRTPEGETQYIAYKGSVLHTLKDICGGIQSACTYIGAPCIKSLPKCTTFIKVNRIK